MPSQEESRAWSERARKVVSPDVVEAVERQVGMGIGAWDTIDPREIILAAYEIMDKEVRLEGS